MKYECLYDERFDIMAPVPDLSVDLALAIEHGVVLDTGSVVEHNEIDNPSSIVGRVRDCFDAFEAQRAIKAPARAAAKSAQADSAAAPAATSAAAASSVSTPSTE